MLAKHATTIGDTVCGAAAAAVSAVTYATSLADTPVAVGAAAHRVAGHCRYQSRKDVYPQFVDDASTIYLDDLTDKLLAAAPVA